MSCVTRGQRLACFTAVQIIYVFIDKHADPYKQSSTQMNTILFDITLHLYSTCIFVLNWVLTLNYYFKINLSEFQYRVRDKKYTKPNFHKFVILEMS